MKKQIVLCFLIYINFVVCAQGNNSLTLKGTIFLDLNNNPAIKSAKQMLESCHTAAKSEYLPRYRHCGACKQDKQSYYFRF
jgi:hypothetical protein